MEVLMWVVFKVFYLLYDLPSMAIGSGQPSLRSPYRDVGYRVWWVKFKAWGLALLFVLILRDNVKSYIGLVIPAWTAGIQSTWRY
jgi:hypothetical protein